MDVPGRIWEYIFWFSLVWVVAIGGVMVFESYLLWATGKGFALFDSHHRLKMALLTFPMLVVFYWSYFKRKKLHERSGR